MEFSEIGFSFHIYKSAVIKFRFWLCKVPLWMYDFLGIHLRKKLKKKYKNSQQCLWVKKKK